MKSLYYVSGLVLLITAASTMYGDVKVTVKNNTEFYVVFDLINTVISSKQNWLNPRGKSRGKAHSESGFRLLKDEILTDINAEVATKGKDFALTRADGWKGSIKEGDVNFVVEAVPGTSNKYRVVKQ